ncbi:MAG: hypothetical protein KAR21_26140 [Spirochaetales bacterium]|nr:hypothetical protein [Spirochaetales bacterium]
MKNIFRKYSGRSINNIGDNVDKKDFLYCLIHLPFQENTINKDEDFSLIGRVFEFAEASNGDVNQFFCDTILVLFGVPIDFGNKYEDIKDFLIKLSKIPENIKVIAGEDNGLYGSFGYPKRLVVTAISKKLAEDNQKIRQLPSRKIVAHKELIDKTGSIDNIEII